MTKDRISSIPFSFLVLIFVAWFICYNDSIVWLPSRLLTISQRHLDSSTPTRCTWQCNEHTFYGSYLASKYVRFLCNMCNAHTHTLRNTQSHRERPLYSGCIKDALRIFHANVAFVTVVTIESMNMVYIYALGIVCLVAFVYFIE